VLSRRFASAVLPMAVAPFVDTLRQTLLEKFSAPALIPQVVQNNI